MSRFFIISFFLYFFHYGHSIAQTDSHKFINLALWNKISTNGEGTDSITNNISLGLAWNNSRNINGLAIAGLFSRTEGIVNGLIIGGLITHTQKTNGVQIGSINISESLQGLQIGGFNSARTSSGAQIGFSNLNYISNGLQLGFYNQTEIIQGVQIGIINETENIRGVQIGLINVSHKNNYPIGLINIINNGEKNAGLTIDEMNNLVASFRSGGKITYGILGIGYHIQHPYQHILVEMGIGIHINISSKFRIDQEFICNFLLRTKPTTETDKKEKQIDSRSFNKYSYRILPSLQISKHFRIFGGPSANYSYTRHEENIKMFTSNYLWRRYKPNSYKQINLGWLVGIQYVF